MKEINDKLYAKLKELGIINEGSNVRNYNIGASDYSTHVIQPWSIWIDYNLNPFDADMSEDKTYEPTLEDTKTFVYSAWAEAVANVQTPFICASSIKKGIRKQAFRDIQKGKYLNKKVKDIMNDFILKLSGNIKVINKNEENNN